MKHYSPRTWKKALLSGDYKRGKDQLKNRGKYCCLGVYRDMVGGPEINADVYLRESAPPWLSKKDQYDLANRNDVKEQGPGWDPDGPVIEYIDTVIIPAYDRARKAK